MRPLLLIFATTSAGLAQDAAPGYAKEIAPLLEKRCGGCHGGEAKMGEFTVNTFEGMMRGGNHGRPVQAGKPDESLLYQMIIGKAYPRMPMDGTSLTDGETELIKRWIETGGKGPTAGEAQNLAQRAAQAKSPDVKPRGAVKPSVYAMAWQPGGGLLALASHKVVNLVDAATRKPVATLEGHAHAVRAVAFSSDGKLLAAAGGLCARTGEVKIWDVAARRVTVTVAGHADCIYGLAFSPDGKTVATSSYDKLIKLWDVATGNEIRTLKDHIDAVYALQFTPDGKRLVSAAADRTVKVWDPATGVRLYTFSESTDALATLAIDPAGKHVAAAGQDKSIRVWRMDAMGGELVQSLMAHEDAILKLAWSPDGTTLVSSSADRSVKVLRARDLSEVKVLGGQSDWAYGLQFSPDGKRLAIARLDGSLGVEEVAGR